MTILEWFSLLLLVGGSLFGIIGAVGVVRLPDFYSRLHAVGITDTLCAALVLLGLVLQADDWSSAIKVLLVLFFLILTSPVSTHVLGSTAETSVCPLPQPWTTEEHGDAD